jgi:hypothetical protein
LLLASIRPTVATWRARVICLIAPIVLAGRFVPTTIEEAAA